MARKIYMGGDDIVVYDSGAALDLKTGAQLRRAGVDKTAALDAALSQGGEAAVVDTLAAAGSAQGDAAQIVSDVVTVTASDGTKGVILPTGVAGKRVLVVNTVAAQNLKVYGKTGAAIDYGAANAAYTLAGQKHALFVAYSATQWYAVLGA